MPDIGTFYPDFLFQSKSGSYESAQSNLDSAKSLASSSAGGSNGGDKAYLDKGARPKDAVAPFLLGKRARSSRPVNADDGESGLPASRRTTGDAPVNQRKRPLDELSLTGLEGK